MSTGKRAFDIARGYFNQEFDRIRGVLDKDALEELDSDAGVTSVRVERSVTVQQTTISDSPEEWARRVLDVGPSADFTEIRKAFEKLNKACDASQLPPDSEAAKKRSSMQRKVQQAYTILTESIDTTEKRFRSLEID